MADAAPATPPLEEKLRALALKDKAKKDKAAAHAAASAAKPAKEATAKDKDAGTKLGLSVTRAEDFGAWYSQVVVEAELISYYDVSGARAPVRLAFPHAPCSQAATSCGRTRTQCGSG